MKKRLKRLKKLGMIMLLTIMMSVMTISAQAFNLGVSRCAQEKTKWCWAASAQMIGKYKGYSKTQTQIVTYIKGSAVNSAANITETGKAIKYAANKSTTVTNQITYGEIKGYIGTSSSKGNPIAMRLKWSSTSGHIVVCDGYSTSNGTNMIRIIDPASGCGTKNYSYSKVAGGSNTYQSGTGTWTNTIIVLQ